MSKVLLYVTDHVVYRVIVDKFLICFAIGNKSIVLFFHFFRVTCAVKTGEDEVRCYRPLTA